MSVSSIDHPQSRVAERGLALADAMICVALLAMWIPHYLTWPWFRDVDAFAVTAQSWHAGILPYRDIHGFNFPGEIYLLWILGNAFGWGNTAALYAVDVALVLTLGAASVAWSRRCFGRSLPGIVAYLAFLAQYLDLDYGQVAQRDWNVAWLVVLALFTLQSSHTRGARVTSALLTALAFGFRPHVVLFLPALLLAVHENVRAVRETDEPTTRALVAWAAIVASGVVAMFSPLMAAGVLPDFMRGLGVAMYGGPYAQNETPQIVAGLREQLNTAWRLIVVLIAPMLWMSGSTRVRQLAPTWSLAIMAALLYKPLHPVQHDYLLRPLEVMSAIAIGLLVAWLLAGRPIGLLAVVAVTWAVLPTIPRFCSVADSARVLSSLADGRQSEEPPPGSRQWLHAGDSHRGYAWSDYRDVLSYLRSKTDPQTIVANLLRRFPFPPLNGPSGRLSPFMVESGICWMWLVNQNLDAVFAESLHRATSSIVVWVPDEAGVEPRMRLPQLIGVVRQEYEFDARFGRIEVWRRRDRGIAGRIGATQ